ncbi:MAG: patatin-like phospholipase family protein [Deltaproteobacteria bacterium]|nr:patatin-like phospholipase family protein [Deltaproteobacteria bacterium]
MNRTSVRDALSAGKRTVMYLPGGGITGGLYQLGALTALEEGVEGFRANALGGYVAVGSGAVLATALAGGLETPRLYRALLDPSDTFFALERRHLLVVDVGEWRRAAFALFGAIRSAIASARQRPVETAVDPWKELDRLYDVLPAGMFSLEPFEHFFDAFLDRRGIGSLFRDLPRPLIIPAHDLDTGDLVPFGARGADHHRIARAVCASMALPLFFAPVRIGERTFFAGSTGNASALELAIDELAAEVVLVVNPLVPVSARGAHVPTGHGAGDGVRDKGLLWVYNQAMRIGEQARLRAELGLLSSRHPGVQFVVIEPSAVDAVRFMDSPMKYSARRTILEEAFRSVREQVRSGASIPPPRSERPSAV